MSKPLAGVLDWVEERTGAVSAVGEFFEEDIPASSGWHQVFGSVALFLFTIQVFTGILLAINFAPTPGESYDSVKFIMSQVTGGALVRGLHHFGSSAMMIVVVLHMVQVAIWGAYKKPREATWMVGVVLLLLTTAFGLTGYLLPWDNKAYWGTVVTTQIAGLAPGGAMVQEFLGVAVDGAIGVITFARFYAMHTLVLPAITALLIGVHVYLVRKHGVAPSPDDAGRPTKKFYPGQVFKDTLAVFATFAALFLTAAMVEAPLEKLADPLDTAYIPRPEWYFLFLFQLLKFFEGSLEVVGAVILPGLAVAALFALPFIDRGKVQYARKRVLAMGMVAFAGIGWAALTYAAFASTPHRDTAVEIGPEHEWKGRSAQALAGFAVVRSSGCTSCHNVGEGEPKPAPTLAGIAVEPGWEQTHPGAEGETPSFQMAAQDAQRVTELFAELTPINAGAFESAPQAALDGANLYVANNCAFCHALNGSGGELGPALDGVGAARDATWLAAKIVNPQESNPTSTMPPAALSGEPLDQLAAFLAEMR